MKPQINQIEVNPWNQRVEDQEWHEKYDVQVEAWAPLQKDVMTYLPIRH